MDTLTYPELVIRIWMSSKRSASLVIGISMALEICLILGQDSQNLLYSKTKLLSDLCGPGGDWRGNSLYPGQIIYGQSSGSQLERTPSWRRSKNGLKKKIHLDNARKLRGIYFIDPEGKEFKETIKNARKKLETSVALVMHCKIMKNCGSGRSDKNKTKLAVFWKLMNPQECVWESRYHQIIKTILQEKEKIDHNNTNYFTNLFFCLKPWKFLQRKQRWTRNGNNWSKILAWNLTKVRSEKEVIDEARASGATVHFASSMDIGRMLIELFSEMIL